MPRIRQTVTDKPIGIYPSAPIVDPRDEEIREIELPKVAQGEAITFRGLGSILLKVGNTSRMVSFKPENNYLYTTRKKEIIDALIQKGYQPVGMGE